MRGLLALWVVVGHVLKHAGYDGHDMGMLKFLVNPGLAVDVFIMLSGFVVFFLLDQQKISYLQFLVRRWFRLAPVFYLVLIASALTLQWQLEVIAATPWKGDAVANDLGIHLDSAKYLIQHFLAHLSMLHGLIPDAVLPNSQYAIVGQAWSISVEWQFYIVAPLIFFWVNKKQWDMVSFFVIFACVLRFAHYAGEGFAINQTGFFLTGIMSYYLWKKADYYRHTDARLLEMFALLAIAFVYFYTTQSLSLILWIVLMMNVLTAQHASPSFSQKYLGRILHHPVFLWLGKVSYSVYLTHMLVLYLVQYCVLKALPQINQFYFVCLSLPMVIALTLLLAALIWRLIEAPGIKLGRKVTSSPGGVAQAAAR